MKYLLLLLLVSCASQKPNCVVVESGMYLGTHFSILRCNRVPICQDGDLECLNSTKCADENDNGSYNCVRRD